MALVEGARRPAAWLLDNSVASMATTPRIATQLDRISEPMGCCPFGRLEQLFSAQSAADYDETSTTLSESFFLVDPPDTVFDDALALQRDLAHHHGLWHRIAIPDLFIAVTALAHGYGVIHNDKDYERIREIRPLITRRIG